MVKNDWSALVKPGVTALVGAGGKTTVLTKLVEHGLYQGQATLVTTTTKLYVNQVAHWQPYYGENFESAQAYCQERIHAGKAAAWFSAQKGTKVEALSCRSIDHMALLHPQWQILVEADGAKEKWLKAPKLTEPVIPSSTSRTIGLMNLAMLGQPLSYEYVHNLEEVLSLLECREGDLLTPARMAKLILHPHGLFQYAKGQHILFCTGCDLVASDLEEELIGYLGDSFIEAIVLAQGHKMSCQIRRYIQCR